MGDVVSSRLLLIHRHRNTLSQSGDNLQPHMAGPRNLVADLGGWIERIGKVLLQMKRAGQRSALVFRDMGGLAVVEQNFPFAVLIDIRTAFHRIRAENVIDLSMFGLPGDLPVFVVAVLTVQWFVNKNKRCDVEQSGAELSTYSLLGGCVALRLVAW